MMPNDSRASAINTAARHERAIMALVSNPTIKLAAKQCKISESTILRWLRDCPEFITAYREARRQVMRHAIAQLQSASSVAVTTLQDVAQDADAPAAARVSASKAILEMAVKSIEVDDFDARISALEGAHE